MKVETPEKPEIAKNQTDDGQTPPGKKGGGDPSVAGLVDLDSITADITSQMPDVQEHAIEQEKATEAETLAQYADLRDVQGNPFDPELHKTNKSGEPTLSPKGKLVKKPGRSGSRISSKAGPAPDPSIAAAKIQARASGAVAANLLLQIGIIAGGTEWQPLHDPATGMDEKSMLEGAFSDWFEATGKTDIPPGLAVCVAVGAYVLPRFTMPKTRTRMSKLKAGIVGWWANRKLKKHGLKVAKAQSAEV